MERVEELLPRQHQDGKKEIVEEPVQLDHVKMSTTNVAIDGEHFAKREPSALFPQRVAMDIVWQLIPEDVVRLGAINGAHRDIVSLSGHFARNGANDRLDAAAKHGWMNM